jgi:hypothetical protein
MPDQINNDIILQYSQIMRSTMKQLLLLSTILAVFSIPAYAAPIAVKVVATDVFDIYGSFSNSPSGSPLDNDAIKPIISSNTNNTIYGLSNLDTSESIATDYVAIELGFGGNKVVTGPGVDLAIFSLWSGFDYTFGLQAFDTNNTLLSSYNYTVDGSSLFGASTTVSVISIDLFDNSFGNDSQGNPNIIDGSNGVKLEDNIELGYITMFIGNDYNGATGGTIAYSNVSLVGAYHTQTAVVPLPLPIILFSSGLALLGWIGRRKTA